MTINTACKFSVALALSALGLSLFGADAIQLAQPRPMMILVGKLFYDYGYMVTYEDAPVDLSRDVTVTTRPDGVLVRNMPWRPVVFHVPAVVEPASSGSEAGSAQMTKSEPTGHVKPATGMIEPMMQEYNNSGNIGQFSVIYDEDYAHVVQTKRLVDGQLADFEPILSTVVPVVTKVGTCGDLLHSLWSELHDVRGINKNVMENVPEVPLGHLCVVEGHNIPARAVLIQILDELNIDPRTHARTARYGWSFVYEPNIESYFLSVRLAMDPFVTVTPKKK